MSPFPNYLESLGEIMYRQATGEPKARPSTYKGVLFRSHLESLFARHLDKLGVEWVYEPRFYGTPDNGYLPDFEIVSATVPTFIEVKPTLEEVDGATIKMAVIWDTHPDAILMVACKERNAFFVSGNDRWWETFNERWSW